MITTLQKAHGAMRFVRHAAWRSSEGMHSQNYFGHVITYLARRKGVWMVDGVRRSATDTLAFINELYKEHTDGI
jgi:hypothetical protein